MKLKHDDGQHYDVGVLVARFQVHRLHDAHRGILNHLLEHHDKVVLFLGVSPLWVTRRNPLDFEARKQMVLAEFPQISVLYIEDVGNHPMWSKRLDRQIDRLAHPGQSVVIYGGRQGFLDSYTGRFPTREFEQEGFFSGTAIRREVGTKATKATEDFRAGVIWATQARFPVAYTTVDVAIYNHDYTELLLARKPFENLLRFVGGFAMPDSPSFEDDAVREVREETHVEISPPQYIGSFHIPDWRYRGETDQIKTLLFGCQHIAGVPQPDDDIEECRWVPVTIDPVEVMPNHRPLLAAAQSRVLRPRPLADRPAYNPNAARPEPHPADMLELTDPLKGL